jgi:hypothetical protein
MESGARGIADHKVIGGGGLWRTRADLGLPVIGRSGRDAKSMSVDDETPQQPVPQPQPDESRRNMALTTVKTIVELGGAKVLADGVEAAIGHGYDKVRDAWHGQHGKHEGDGKSGQDNGQPEGQDQER